MVLPQNFYYIKLFELHKNFFVLINLMNFGFLEENYEEPFYDRTIMFPQIIFDKKMRFDQFYSRSELVLQRIKHFNLPKKIIDIISFDKKNTQFSHPTLINYQNLISYYKNKESVLNDDQKLLTIAFITTYVNELKLFEKFSSDIQILFQPLVFPTDPVNSDHFNFTQNIDLFLLDYIYQTDDSNAFELYNKIFYYWCSASAETILNFMPLLIQLLYQWKSNNFFSVFKQTSLFVKILNAAQSNYFLFNFVLNCVEIYPEDFFQSKNGLSMISFYFFNKDLRVEAASIIDKALKVANQGQQIQKEVFQVISTIISSFIDKEDPEAIIILYDMVTNCFPDLQLSLIQDAFQTSIFDQMAKIAISSIQYFTKFLFFLTKMGTEYYDFIEFYGQRKSIHIILNQFHCETIPLFDILKFAFCSSVTKDYTHQYIRNWTAINLLLNIFLNSETTCSFQEEEIVKSLFKLSQNKGNLIELNRAKVPEFILKRFPSIQNNEDMRNKYLTLFSTITMSIYDNATFYRTIELLKNPKFKYPTEILNKLNQNLTLAINQQHTSNPLYNANNNRIMQNVPMKFFRFDNPKGCGIFGPTVKLSSSFSIFFWIRLNDIVNHISFPLLFFNFERGQIYFEFEETHLYVRESRKQEKHKFNFEFEQGIWYYIVITSQWSLSYQNISLYVNNNKESVRISSKTWNPLMTECSLSICSTSSNPKSPSLLCDLSNLYVINSIDSNLDLTKMVKNSPDSIVCNYDPSNAHEGQCFNVTSSGSTKKSVPYKGRTIPTVSILENVVKTVGAVKNFFPLFDRVSTTPFHDGIKISSDFGSNYLRYLVSIISQMISISESNFIENGFFEIFASFLNDCESNFMTISVIKELSILLFSLESDELRSQMMKHVFLNYGIASKLDASSSSNLFATVLKMFVYEDHKFIYEFDYGLLVYKTIQYFYEESKISENAWIFLKHVLLSDPFALKDSIESLLINLSLFKSNYATEKILELLFFLISNETVVFFEEFSYYSPFIIPISECSTNAQITSLDCILKLNKFADFKIDNAVNEIIEVLQKNDAFFDLFTEHVESLLINDETSKLNLSLLPLLVKSASLSSDHQKIVLADTFHQFLIESPDVAISLFDFPLWYSYLMTLLELAYDANEYASKFSIFFAELFTHQLKKNQGKDFVDFFNYLILRSFLNNVSYSKLKSKILVELLENEKLNNKEQILLIFPVAFEFIVFEIAIVSNDPNAKLSFQVNSTKLLKTEEYLKPSSLIIKLASNLNDKVKILDTVEVNIVLAVAFVAFTVFEPNSEENSKFISEVAKNFSKYDNETRESCNLIITFSICPTNDFDLIKSTWFKSIFVHSNDILKTKEAKIDQINENLNEGKIDFIRIGDDSSIARRLISISNPNFFTFFYADSEGYINAQKTKFDIEQNMITRLKKSFLLDIAKAPGPWQDINDDVKFKALNRISKHGQRILMNINKRFDDHRIASSNRDRKIQEEVSKENFYYKQIKQMPFIHETRVFTTEVTIRSLWKQIPGTLNVSSKMIHFFSESKNFSIVWNKVEFILNRRVANIDNSCEIFTVSGRSYFIIFPKGERKRLYSYISKMNLPIRDTKSGNRFDFFLSLRHLCQSLYQNKNSPEIVQKLSLPVLWKNREITTYSYIYYLNMLSGRSFNDTKQYPIFPILVKNCDSDSFDLNDYNSYRDLSKPTAFICQKQSNIPPGLNQFNQLPSNEFLTAWSMVRVEPFTTFQILLQGNKFLEASRQLFSIQNYWNFMNRNATTNENIPEFFTFPFLYVNENRFDLGVRPNDKIRVDDIGLPNWADDAFIYTSANRIALESDIASQYINKWIDLFFGIHRRFLDGKKLYPYFAYSELQETKKRQLFQDNSNSTSSTSFDNDSNEEDIEIKFEENVRIYHCEHFGTMPSQLFDHPHEERGHTISSTILKKTPQITNFAAQNPIILIKKNLIICQGLLKAYMVNSNIKDDDDKLQISELSLPAGIGELLCVSRKLGLAFFGTKTDPFLTIFNTKTSKVETSFHHNSIITAATVVAGRYLITGGSDCTLYVWDLESTTRKKPISSSGFHSDSVTSIGCCYENGLLVSADSSSTLVFETLIDHVFIASVSIEKICGRRKRATTFKKRSFTFRTDPNERETKNNERKGNEEEENKKETEKETESSETNNKNDTDEIETNNSNLSQNESSTTNNSTENTNKNETENNSATNENQTTSSTNKAESSNTNNTNENNSATTESQATSSTNKVESSNTNNTEPSSSQTNDTKNSTTENKSDTTHTNNTENSDTDDDDYDVNESIFVPQIVVFPSGAVCVSQKKSLLWLDSRGRLIKSHKLSGPFTEMRKYCDLDTREFLIVGSFPKFIDIIDVTTFAPFARIKVYQFHFYPIKNTRSVLVSSLNELHVYSFGDCIPQIISKKRKKGEEPSLTILKEQKIY